VSIPHVLQLVFYISTYFHKRQSLADEWTHKFALVLNPKQTTEHQINHYKKLISRWESEREL